MHKAPETDGNNMIFAVGCTLVHESSKFFRWVHTCARKLNWVHILEIRVQKILELSVELIFTIFSKIARIPGIAGDSRGINN